MIFLCLNTPKLTKFALLVCVRQLGP